MEGKHIIVTRGQLVGKYVGITSDETCKKIDDIKNKPILTYDMYLLDCESGKNTKRARPEIELVKKEERIFTKQSLT